MVSGAEVESCLVGLFLAPDEVEFTGARAGCEGGGGGVVDLEDVVVRGG